jgi:hypothetical protein
LSIQKIKHNDFIHIPKGHSSTHTAPGRTGLPVTVLDVQALFLRQQLFYRLFIEIVRYAAIDGANSRTLRLFMETLAFCALIGRDIVGIYADGSIPLAGVHDRTVQERERAFHAGTIGNSPFNATFINGIIGTFGLTGSAIDTFFGYFNRHIF